jgi:DNA-binding MarR family transcriptional regulator
MGGEYFNWLNRRVFALLIEKMSAASVSLIGRAVYFTILSFADAGGVAFPGLETISERTGVSRRSVIYAISELEEKGFLTVDRYRKRKGGGDLQKIRPNIYYLTPIIEKHSADPAHSMCKPRPINVQNTTDQCARNDPPNGSQRTVTR